MPELMNPASGYRLLPLIRRRPGLPHDDFRRAHDEFRGMHHDYWRSDDDCVMTFVARVLVPSAIRNKTSGGGEEGENAGKKQDFFHIWFGSLSGGRYAMGGDFSMGCNPNMRRDGLKTGALARRLQQISGMTPMKTTEVKFYPGNS